ncbi:hypothetical protein GQX74_011891 [Glossina fuscipes]|nr:hypothetical protein GQX74_011891 [Glossina fuscipes]
MGNVPPIAETRHHLAIQRSTFGNTIDVQIVLLIGSEREQRLCEPDNCYNKSDLYLLPHNFGSTHISRRWMEGWMQLWEECKKLGLPLTLGISRGMILVGRRTDEVEVASLLLTFTILISALLLCFYFLCCASRQTTSVEFYTEGSYNSPTKLHHLER